jgi:hypothetical protein
MAIILKANQVNLFVSSALFVFWYHSPNFLDKPHICDISRLRVNPRPLHVGKVALAQVCLGVLLFATFVFIVPVLHIHSSIYARSYVNLAIDTNVK